ncbi:MAG TPA: hypothetical protein VMZ30_02090 [Pyrinomonadaceae bacterium]|nr:hypothetical protein [Pyrinomonadaceae bacterium]
MHELTKLDNSLRSLAEGLFNDQRRLSFALLLLVPRARPNIDMLSSLASRLNQFHRGLSLLPAMDGITKQLEQLRSPHEAE